MSDSNTNENGKLGKKNDEFEGNRETEENVDGLKEGKYEMENNDEFKEDNDNHEENNDDHGFFSKSRSLAPRYVRDSWREIRKVTWPGFKTTWKLVFAVFVFAIVIGGFIAALDWGLEKLFREVIL